MKIAILDSGINSNCIENPACIIDRKSFLLKDDSILIGSDCDDAFGHGTFCLQTIRRIAPDSEFICIKVLNDDGLTCAEVLIEALKSLLSVDVDIINLSLSVTNPDYDDGELKQVCQMLY
ncbi:MAG: hypothetical protein IJJ69_05355, partial [Oscillospiraceae bacterium]|nr:hypothetical protein [Oscillospiraceae bacterium]